MKHTFKKNQKVIYNNKVLTVLNTNGLIINGEYYIPCADGNNLIDDYPVAGLTEYNDVFDCVSDDFKQFNILLGSFDSDMKFSCLIALLKSMDIPKELMSQILTMVSLRNI